MHAIYCHTQNNTYTKMNLNRVKWAQWDKTQCRELLGLFICVCSSLCTIVAHNTAQNRPDNFPSCPPDNHHCSNDVYLRERGRATKVVIKDAENKNSRSTSEIKCYHCVAKTVYDLLSMLTLLVWQPPAILRDCVQHKNRLVKEQLKKKKS